MGKKNFDLREICSNFKNYRKTIFFFKMGFYYFCLTGAVKTALLEGLNCKSLVVRQSVTVLRRPFQSKRPYNLFLKFLKPGREKQSPGSTLNLTGKKMKRNYFPCLTENLFIKFRLLRASPPPCLKGED